MSSKTRVGILLIGVLALNPITQALAGDPANGEKDFAPCKICHQIGETAKNSVGPALNGVIGRKAGTYPGYNYSDANKDSELTWDEATFREYIRDPKAKVPGTKMTYAGERGLAGFLIVDGPPDDSIMHAGPAQK